MGNSTFAQRVKAEREKRGLSVDKLAGELNIQKSRVGMWESNGTVPRSDVLVQLCQFFGVTADYLLGNDTKTGGNPHDEKINSIERGLNNLNETELETAENILRAAFAKAFGEVK